MGIQKWKFQVINCFKDWKYVIDISGRQLEMNSTNIGELWVVLLVALHTNEVILHTLWGNNFSIMKITFGHGVQVCHLYFTKANKMLKKKKTFLTLKAVVNWWYSITKPNIRMGSNSFWCSSGSFHGNVIQHSLPRINTSRFFSPHFGKNPLESIDSLKNNKCQISFLSNLYVLDTLTQLWLNLL